MGDGALRKIPRLFDRNSLLPYIAPDFEFNIVWVCGTDLYSLTLVSESEALLSAHGPVARTKTEYILKQTKL
jgi:hypothetical protein